MRILFDKARCAVAPLAFGLLGCRDTSEPRLPGQVNAERVLEASRGEAAESGNWLTHGRTFDEQRFSPLDRIHVDNVRELGLAWSYKLDFDRGTEATPIVVDGILYTTGPWSVVYALDAGTGELRWKYDPQVPREIAVRACCDVVNRGVAVWQGKVYVGTLDGYLVALDAGTGEVAWKVDTIVNRARSYSITGAPRIAAGNVVIGNGGAELGVRGYATAYDAETGNQAWRFFTVPGNPEEPFESKAMEEAAGTWSGDKWWEYGGGGTVWDSMAYDPEHNLLYIGVGNGSPWTRRDRSPGGGDNWFLSSIVALNAESGEYVWHYQTTPGDNWDYTATQHIILADLQIEGERRSVLMQAPKNGFFYVIDRLTGELLSARNYVQVTWATHVDLESGRPVEASFSDYGTEPVLIWPSPYGGHNWQPMAFDPRRGWVYIPAQELPFPYARVESFRLEPRGFNAGIVPLPPPEEASAVADLLGATGGKLIAWDPLAQSPRWTVTLEHPFNGGVLATAGNLVFSGTADGRFVAYASESGDVLWEASAQTGVIAAPVTYMVDGEQYVAVMAGWGGAFGLIGGDLARATGVRSLSRVLAYKIGGKESLPPLPEEAPMPEPPPLTASLETQRRGRELFHQQCMWCHGAGAVGGGVVADLRYLDEASHESFVNLTLSGLADAGMPGFEGFLTEEDISAIRAYVVKRAHDEKSRRAAAGS